MFPVKHFPAHKSSGRRLFVTSRFHRTECWCCLLYMPLPPPAARSPVDQFDESDVEAASLRCCMAEANSRCQLPFALPTL